MKIPLSWIREFAALPKDIDLERLENEAQRDFERAK